MFLSWVTEELMILLANCWGHKIGEPGLEDMVNETPSNRGSAIWSPLNWEVTRSMVTLKKFRQVVVSGVLPVLMILHPRGK